MILAPSILSADFANLQKDVQAVENAGCEYLHIDIMDGHFVPNISFGAPIVKAIRKHSKAVFDVHLMISDPNKYLDDFVKAGADIITFHLEAVEDAEALIKRIKEKGIKACVSVKPGTPIEEVYPYLDMLDMVLIMTVEPGFGGQKFITEMFDKMYKLKAEIDRRGLKVDIEADGGIGADNVASVVEAGVNIIVAGSAIFNTPDISETVKIFREKVK
ncbi:MAG: ribulose-phosphate 3-epimerase [Ruminococcaceae bacterium]|nr:ribulose-phosphate 3-epimerase [Oscillospiraceae bacterium]